MNFAVCCVPVSALRIEPSHKSEMVSQQLFGECCTILETIDEKWIKIKCRFDDYEGWCQQAHVVPIDEEFFLLEEKDLTKEWVNEINYNGYQMYVPLGGSLTALKNSGVFWRKSSVQYKGEIWNPAEVKITAKLVKQLAFKFLNTTYLWGGKSVFGIDCSGFAQQTYKFLNVALPRDAWQQAEQGTTVNFLQEAKCGDLAFFDNDEGFITHVGILLNSNEIIHASGKVRIDKIDTQGILNIETKQRTHKLRIIKRYFNL
jgi:gamma-D-glutamyl-L-lysine dipeptidyl-peptidase